ncbi:hypothetical protein FOZ62_011380 [Perkinsus olseni]|uniref:Uncharacterized protein n=1 Tax=Perkinsus olseni TaxID=32597 RepID=A0A7J6TB35_PEROL|nr:hypothetical protein FOZ62_011380 [Perkinsus olseni]
MSVKVIDTQGLWRKIRNHGETVVMAASQALKILIKMINVVNEIYCQTDAAKYSVDVSEVSEYVSRADDDEPKSGVNITREKLLQEADAFKRSVVKFGCFCAQLQSDDELSSILLPAGRELANTFGVLCTCMTAVALKGGKCLTAEVAALGDDINKLVDNLNAAALTDRASVSRICGALLERIQRVKKMSLEPSSACRKIVIRNIKCMQDAQDELASSLERAKEGKKTEEEAPELVDDEEDVLDFDGDDDLFLVESAEELIGAIGSLAGDMKRLAVSAADDILAERSRKVSSKIDEIVVAITTGSDDEEEFDDLFDELEREGCGERMGKVREIVRREMISKA